MPIQNKFTTTTPAIASYDYTDLANQVGYINFYATVAEDSTGEVHKLFPEILATRTASTSVLAGNNTTLTFEYEFIKPFISDGNAHVEAGFRAYSNYSSSETFNVTLQVSLYHWDGTTETQLGSTIEEIATSPGNQTYSGETQNAVIAIDNQLFKEGETLRLKVYLAAGGSGNANSNGLVFHEPNNSTTYSDAGYIPSTALIVKMPFKIQV